MKKLSVIVVSIVLAVAILFGSLIGQTGTAHAASTSSGTQSLNALISKVEQHVHVVDHHATIDSQLHALISQQQFREVQQAVATYNRLAVSPTGTPSVLIQHSSDTHQANITTQSKAHPGYWSYCYYISNGDMDKIAWAIILGGGVATVAGILVALVAPPAGAAISIAAVIVALGGTYLLWYSDKYWPNGSNWCVNSYGNVWYYGW